MILLSLFANDGWPMLRLGIRRISEERAGAKLLIYTQNIEVLSKHK